MSSKQKIVPLSWADWLRALPWLLLVELIYLFPYFFREGGVAGKYIWDEHCVAHTYPVAWLAREEVLSGFFPLWNPYSGCGLPLVGNTLDEALLPYAVVKYLLPFPVGLNLYLALRLFIALTGAFALGRSLGATRQGAILSGVLYGFTGFITLNINSVIGTTFVLPWCLFGLHRLALQPRLSSLLLTALAFGVSLLGGNPQTPYQALLLGFGLYLVSLLSQKIPLSFSRYLLLPGCAVAPALLLGLPQLLPFFEYLSRAFSHHFPGYGQWHLDPRGVIGVMSPLWNPAIVNMCRGFFSSPEAVLAEAFEQGTSYANTTIPIPFEHLGLGAIFFLILALLNLRRLPGEATYFAGVLIICLGLAFGLFPFSMISRVPPFDQVSNWRFTTFPAGLAGAALAGMLYGRLLYPILRRRLVFSLVILVIICGAGMALVSSQAGLPLSSFFILGPIVGVLILLALLATTALLKSPQPLIAFCFLELFLYDRLTDRSLMPHPFLALRTPTALTQCAPPDPNFRFLAYDEVLHPSLGIFLKRYDFRSYEMIFPDDFVRWLAAVNGWNRLETIRYYMTHYYFAPTSEALLRPEFQAASVSAVLAQDFLPHSNRASNLLENSELLAPGPEFIRPAGEVLAGIARQGWFMHAPSRVRLLRFREEGKSSHVREAPSSTLPLSAEEEWPRLAGFVAMLKSSWEKGESDGVVMQVVSGETGERKLLYSRFLNPRARPEEGGWLPFFAPGEVSLPLMASVLPGPRNDWKSDYGLFADFHDPQARAEFQGAFELTGGGEVKCYQARKPRPRLRVAKAVRVVRDLESCLAGTRQGAFASGEEVIVEPADRGWPTGSGRVERVEWAGNYVRAEVEMDSAGTLVLADTFYPGWTAWVEGTPTPVHRANCVFRAIQVPAGKHVVVFRFLPRSFQIGLWAGLSAWLFFLTIFLEQRSPRTERERKVLSRSKGT